MRTQHPLEQLVSDNGIAYNVTTQHDIDEAIMALTRRLRRCSANLPKLRAMIERDRDQLLEFRAHRKDNP